MEYCWIRCTRCGKPIHYWHYVNNRPVCADDRSCVPKPRIINRRRGKSKLKVLARVKARYGSGET